MGKYHRDIHECIANDIIEEIFNEAISTRVHIFNLVQLVLFTPYWWPTYRNNIM